MKLNLVMLTIQCDKCYKENMYRVLVEHREKAVTGDVNE